MTVTILTRVFQAEDRSHASGLYRNRSDQIFFPPHMVCHLYTRLYDWTHTVQLRLPSMYCYTSHTCNHLQQINIIYTFGVISTSWRLSQLQILNCISKFHIGFGALPLQTNRHKIGLLKLPACKQIKLTFYETYHIILSLRMLYMYLFPLIFKLHSLCWWGKH